MDAVLNGALIGAVAGLIVGLLMLVVRLLMPAKPCPECGKPMPKVSMPANLNQAFAGGRTCTHCGCEVDGRGRRKKE